MVDYCKGYNEYRPSLGESGVFETKAMRRIRCFHAYVSNSDLYVSTKPARISQSLR